MLKKICGFAFLATSASAMALAGPGGSKGKPDKGGGGDPPGPIEVIFDWSGGDGDVIGVSATNGTSYHEVIAGRQISYTTLFDVAPSGTRGLLSDYGTLELFEWSWNASGGVAGSSAQTIIDTFGSAVTCAAFTKDGSRISYATYGQDVWTVPTNDVTATPTLEYSLPEGQRFGTCDFDIDGTIVAEVITDGPNGNNQARLSRFTLGAGGTETPLVSNGVSDWIRSVDIGRDGSLAYSMRTGEGWLLRYDNAGQVSEMRNAHSATYDCDEGRIIYKSVHPRNGKTNWLIRDLGTGSTSDFPERQSTGRIGWVC